MYNILFLIIFLVCILIISGKWVILFLLLPSLNAFGKYKKTGKAIYKFFAIPFLFINNKLCRGGYILWIFFKVGMLSSCHLRLWLLKLAGADIAEKVIIHIGYQIRTPWNLRIGTGSIIGDHIILDARNGINIGENVNISSNVSIWTKQHDYRNPNFECPNPSEKRLDVKIENRVWLGCNVIVLPGITIGEGAVCCGGCIVTKDVPPYTVVAGIPAKKIGERPKNLVYEFPGKSCRLY